MVMSACLDKVNSIHIIKGIFGVFLHYVRTSPCFLQEQASIKCRKTGGSANHLKKRHYGRHRKALRYGGFLDTSSTVIGSDLVCTKCGDGGDDDEDESESIVKAPMLVS